MMMYCRLQSGWADGTHPIFHRINRAKWGLSTTRILAYPPSVREEPNRFAKGGI
jgi:hypothetical protein